MKYIAAIVILGFISIGIFGFAGFTSAHNNGFMQCAANLTGHGCADSLDMGLLHTKIYQGFSQAILALFVLLATILVAIKSIDLIKSFPKFQLITVSLEPKKPKLINWFTLLEKRDPLV